MLTSVSNVNQKINNQSNNNRIIGSCEGIRSDGVANNHLGKKAFHQSEDEASSFKIPSNSTGRERDQSAPTNRNFCRFDGVMFSSSAADNFKTPFEVHPRTDDLLTSVRDLDTIKREPMSTIGQKKDESDADPTNRMRGDDEDDIDEGDDDDREGRIVTYTGYSDNNDDDDDEEDIDVDSS